MRPLKRSTMPLVCGCAGGANPLEGNFDREVPKYTQIGNAVPVGLAQKVGQHFKKIIDTALG
jgi:DNA (cytosine-5)-methyltransferase 1